MPAAEQKRLILAYRELHNGLLDMLEGGRLKEADIPEDYDWLMQQLSRIADIDQEEG